MSRRAASLVFLALFFTLSAGLLVAQAPRKAIMSASDLPAFSYPISFPTGEFPVNGIRSEEFPNAKPALLKEVDALEVRVRDIQASGATSA